MFAFRRVSAIAAPRAHIMRSTMPHRYFSRNGQFIVSLSGHDRPGIVAELSTELSEMKGNVEESRMTILGGDFAVMMLVSGIDGELMFDKLQHKFPSFLVNARETSPQASFQQPAKILTVTLEGPDQVGVVSKLTKIFADFDVSVRDLDTDTSSAPFAGYKIFSLKAVIGLPINTDMKEFNERLKQFEDDCGIDLLISDPSQNADESDAEE